MAGPAEGRTDALFDPRRGSALPAKKLSPDAASVHPVARVWVEAAVPQLDRAFDYVVPESLSAEAIVGSKVRVVLAGRQVNGWVIERRDTPDTDHELRPLRRVLSPHPILTPDHLALLTTIAHRQLGLVSDVLRLAIPPRVAAVDGSFPPEERDDDAAVPRLTAIRRGSSAPTDPAMRRPQWADSPHGQDYLTALRGGGSPKAVLVAPRGDIDLLLDALTSCWASGRRAVVVVPDHRRLDALTAALDRSAGLEDVKDADKPYARLSADDPPTRRYRAFLSAVYGRVDLVVGTRAAAYAPLEKVGLLAVWDDGDQSLQERRAPYAHARDVLIARAVHADAALLIAGQSPTTEAMRLVEIGWAGLLQMTPAQDARPRVTASGSEFEAARDRLAQAARIPSVAFQSARRALNHGPVLVHVARAGYSPVVKCARCFERALCGTCQGPLVVRAGTQGHVMQCSWCARTQTEFECSFCGGTATYQPVAGALRTAEELGRAFPGVPVIASSGEKIRESVPDTPALVVATPGAEPRVLGAEGVESGYAGALILDAESTLARDTLHALEAALRRWFAVMGLVRARGEVVATVSENHAINALVSCDPVPAIARDYRQRAELGLPPSVRAVTLTGSESGISSFWDRVRSELDAGGPLRREPRVIGPTLLEDTPDGEVHRLLVLFSFADAPRISAAVRARRLVEAAQYKTEKIRVQSDPPEVL